MYTRSPGVSPPRRKNTDGPPVSESTWPSMIDGPGWPGVGEYLYQAASLVSGGSLSGGTWMVPSLFIPTYSSLELTPMAGIEIVTGRDLGIAGPRITVGPGSRAFARGRGAPHAVAAGA